VKGPAAVPGGGAARPALAAFATELRGRRWRERWLWVGSIRQWHGPSRRRCWWTSFSGPSGIDPTRVSRFVSEDPAHLGVYSYASNNPVRLLDPTGLTPVPSCSGGPPCKPEQSEEARNLCEKIKKDPNIRQCVKEGCDNLKLHCNSDPATCTEPPPNGGPPRQIAGRTHGTGDVHICPHGRGCWQKTLVHELGHKCYPTSRGGTDPLETTLDIEACGILKRLGASGTAGGCCS
jgi:hypothetical protein